MKKTILLLAVLLAGVMAAAGEFLKLELAPAWSYYSSTAKSFAEADPTVFTGAPAVFNGIKRETVSFKNGRFLRKDRENPIPSILVNEFTSPADGNMLLRCGASIFRMKVALNGKELLNVRTAHSRVRAGIPGTHDVILPVKKGRNVLAIAYLGAEISAAAGDPAVWRATRPTRENYRRIRYAEPGTKEREMEEMLICRGVDEITAPVYGAFHHEQRDLQGDDLEKIYEQYPVLEFYDQGIRKVLKEIPETTVTKGAVIWHVYNMGHVIKTPECCFAIDISHRLGPELVPLLDFAVVSHKHGDHYDAAFCRAMEQAGKPVLTNFLPDGKVKEPPAPRWIKDVYLEFENTDHNAQLPKFVMCTRMTCGRGKDAPVIYQTGDSCDHTQLRPSGPVDIHILHPRVGLSVPKSAALHKPKQIWFSHLLEMGHCAPSIWRPVDFSDVYWDKGEIAKQGGDVACCYPIWGEKFYIAPVR